MKLQVQDISLGKGVYLRNYKGAPVITLEEGTGDIGISIAPGGSQFPTFISAVSPSGDADVSLIIKGDSTSGLMTEKPEGGQMFFYNIDSDPGAGDTQVAKQTGVIKALTPGSQPSLVTMAIENFVITDVTASSEDARIDLSIITAGAQVTTSSKSGLAIANHVPVLVKTTVTTDSTAGAKTYTAAEWLGGLILRDPNGSGRSDVSPTAAALVAAVPGIAVGDSFEVVIRNTADAAETITLTAASAAVTLSGTMTIAQNNTKRFRVVVTNVGSGTEAVTVYSLGTVVH